MPCAAQDSVSGGDPPLPPGSPGRVCAGAELPRPRPADVGNGSESGSAVRARFLSCCHCELWGQNESSFKGREREVIP